MRYYVTIGKGEAAYRREILFEETAEGLVAHIAPADGEAGETRRVRVDYDTLERGKGLHLLVGDGSHDCYLDPVPGGFEVHYRGDQELVEVIDERELLAQSIHGDAASGPREVCASMPGIVVSIDVEPGREVVAGQTLLVVEAMKMQSPIASEGDGTVGKIHVAEGQAVAAGDLLLTLE